MFLVQWGRFYLPCLLSINIKTNPRQDATFGIPGVGTGTAAFLVSLFSVRYIYLTKTCCISFSFCHWDGSLQKLASILSVTETQELFCMCWPLFLLFPPGHLCFGICIHITAVQLILTHFGWPICLLRFHNCCCCCWEVNLKISKLSYKQMNSHTNRVSISQHFQRILLFSSAIAPLAA